MGAGLSFRKDIEGLRAIAVLLVVAGHVGVPGFGGGFVGVDVFFVISGYIITALLSREQGSTGTIDLAAFYARRVRRLLPAFALMLVAVLAGIYLLTSPFEQPVLLRSVMAAALYISNLHYAWESTSYWGADARTDPLLHTWSLGVEEQFYLVWPLLLLWLLWVRRRKGQLVADVVFAAIFLFSFVLAEIWTLHRPIEAFFFSFLRAWEFGAGAGLVLCADSLDALSRRWRLRAVGGRMVSLGLLMVLASALLYDGNTGFPGLAAVIPVAGAVLVLFAGGSLGVADGGFLARPPMQVLGRLSYGWYLWHWPLLVFGAMVWPHAGLWARLVLAVAALLPAALSFALVESPLRRFGGRRGEVVALGIVLAVPCAAVMASLQMAAIADRNGASPDYEHLLASRGRVPALYVQGCDPGLYGAAVVPCVGGDPAGRKLVVLVGDSHAGQWASAFDAVARAEGWRFMLFTKSACPAVDEPFFYGKLGRVYAECTRWRRDVLRVVTGLHPALVVMSNSEGYPFSDGQWVDGEARVAAALARAGGAVAILRDSPAPGFDVPQCLARRLWQPRLYGGACDFLRRTAVSARMDRLHREVMARVPHVAYIDMTPAICGDVLCRAMSGGTVKYRDGGHLSDDYVKSLVTPLREGLRRAGMQ